MTADARVTFQILAVSRIREETDIPLSRMLQGCNPGNLAVRVRILQFPAGFLSQLTQCLRHLDTALSAGRQAGSLLASELFQHTVCDIHLVTGIHNTLGENEIELLLLAETDNGLVHVLLQLCEHLVAANVQVITKFIL